MNEEINVPNNQEIDKALKEFELKNQAEQVQKSPEVLQNSDVPKMTQMVMKWFGIKEQKQAEYLLLGFVVLAMGISLFLVFGGGNKQPMPSNATLQMIKQMPVNQ